jgi:MFS family permease
MTPSGSKPGAPSSRRWWRGYRRRSDRRQHLDKALTPEQRARWVLLLARSADETGLPAAAEFRAAFTAHLEWAEADRVSWSSPAATRRLGLTSTGYFMVILDSVIVITALPRMQRDLHVSLASLQWTLNAYGIAFAAGIITAAALGDRLGRRKVFTSGPALFTVASVACALAPNASELTAARTVQGLGGAIVLPLSLTILTTAFPAERRGMIVGIYGGLAGLAVAMGPILGGAVTQGIDWHWIFWINVPIGSIAVLLGLRCCPRARRTGATRPRGSRAPHRRHRLPRLGAQPRQ